MPVTVPEVGHRLSREGEAYTLGESYQVDVIHYETD